MIKVFRVIRASLFVLSLALFLDGLVTAYRERPRVSSNATISVLCAALLFKNAMEMR